MKVRFMAPLFSAPFSLVVFLDPPGHCLVKINIHRLQLPVPDPSLPFYLAPLSSHFTLTIKSKQLTTISTPKI
jgi:hypothetical protein